jgi:hypothetical protein
MRVGIEASNGVKSAISALVVPQPLVLSGLESP